MTASTYDIILADAAAKLFKDQGIRDPSIAEVVCTALGVPVADHPLKEPEQLGGETYEGARKRHRAVRQALLDMHGIIAILITRAYYTLGLRHREARPKETALVLPNGGKQPMLGADGKPVLGADGKFQVQASRMAGFRLIVPGEEDPFLAAAKVRSLKGPTTWISNEGRVLLEAVRIGAMSADTGKKIVGDVDDRMGAFAPAKMRHQIGNGPAKPAQ